MNINYENYKYIVNKILTYINENELWKLSKKSIVRTGLINSNKDIYELRKSARSDKINEDLVCKILISRYGKLNCTNKISESKWIDNENELKIFMHRNNEKLIKHGKIVRLYKH